MIKSGRTARWILCSLGACLIGTQAASTQTPAVPEGFVAKQLEEMTPQSGATSVVLMGDPSKPGIYVVQNVFAPGRGSRPHFHDQDRYVTVVKGTWWVALGPDADVYNPDKMVPMKPGSFVFHPANGHHYDGAKDEAVTVRIMGMGPVKSTQLEQPARR
ncbi:MAG: cupin domain-containing protein [Vicinamibacterales bacterium]